MKKTALFGSFDDLDIRVGRILSADEARTRKPTYKLTIDFGPEVGIKLSCGAYRNYPAEALVGRLVIGVVNFAPKQMGPEVSEVLVLGVENSDGQIIYLTPESDVPLGASVF